MIEARQRERERMLSGLERDLRVAQGSLGQQAVAMKPQMVEVDKTRREPGEAGANLVGQREGLERQRREIETASAVERARLEAELAARQAELADASARIIAAQDKNIREKERLAAIARRLMASGPAGLGLENLSLRAELADAQRRIAALAAERDELVGQQLTPQQRM